MLFGTTSNIDLTSRGVALVAVGFHQLIADINRMYKVFDLRAFGDIFLNLADNAVTQVAILGDDLSGGILMLAVVTAETAREVEVSHMCRIGAPDDFHLGEEISGVDTLNLFGSLFDRCCLGIDQGWVILGIILLNPAVDGGGCILVALVGLFQEFTAELFQERQGGVKFTGCKGVVQLLAG